MSRGGSYGGGQSSLGYLFGSDEPPREPPVSPTIYQLPPYGIDITPEKPPNRPSPPEKQSSSNNYQRTQGQNTGNFITVSFLKFSDPIIKIQLHFTICII